MVGVTLVDGVVDVVGVGVGVSVGVGVGDVCGVLRLYINDVEHVVL
jgi:hypothetical protein